jgi:hypothetical protein
MSSSTPPGSGDDNSEDFDVTGSITGSQASGPLDALTALLRETEGTTGSDPVSGSKNNEGFRPFRSPTR